MKKNIITAILLIIVCTLNSCFTITDYIKFNTDGSGSLKTTIDMRNMMQMLGMFLPDSIKQSMKMGNMIKDNPTYYDHIAGITNSKIVSEQEYIYTISFDFANVKALNKAISANTDLSQTDNSSPLNWANIMNSQYTFKKGKISRRTSIDLSNLAQSQGFNIQESKEMFQFMNSPTYSITYELPKKIKKLNIKNEKSNAQKDKNKVTLHYNLFDFLDAKGEIMHHDLKY